MKINIPSSAGDLVDRITILEVKRLCIEDTKKLTTIERHLAELQKVYKTLPRSRTLRELQKQLFEVNHRQWKLEDSVRAYLRDRKINAQFARLVRGIHVSNDKRTRLKRRIDEHVGSHFIDEKQYVS